MIDEFCACPTCRDDATLDDRCDWCWLHCPTIRSDEDEVIGRFEQSAHALLCWSLHRHRDRLLDLGLDPLVAHDPQRERRALALQDEHRAMTARFNERCP